MVFVLSLALICYYLFDTVRRFMIEWTVVCIGFPGIDLRLSPEEAGCLNSLVGTLIQSSVGSESFQERVRWRVEKRPQGNVGPEVVKGLMPVDIGKAALSVGERADGRPRDTGALRAV